MPDGVRAIADKVAELAFAERDEIERMYPHVMRRVGGYNLDIFFPQSERPYTTDNSVNLAHLLVGSEGTLAVTERLTLNLAPLPKHKTLGVVNFASFYKAMDSAQHIVKLKPTAVELVDRTMIELARANPAFRPVIERALIGKPEAILLVEFAGEEREDQLRDLARLVELMADLGLPGSVVEMPEPKPQSELWEVRKAGLNIMMSMKGDGKPVSFIEDCAVPLEHLADYTQRLTDVFGKHGTRGTWYAHASVGTLHVRPILDMRREGAEKMRAIAEEASALVREYKGAFSGEHGDGLVRSEWVAWQFGPRLTRAFETVKDLFDPENILNPGKIVRPSRMDDRSLFRFKPGYESIKYEPALDWSAWNVQTDPVTEISTAPGSGGDLAGGFAKAAEMCNNNGHCRKFDAGTMCPSFRVTRDEKHLTRGRANTLRLALSGHATPFISLAAYASMVFVPILGLIKILKVAENSSNYSIHNTARQMLWLPTTKQMLYQAKPTIDTLFVRLGDGLAALTILIGTRVFSLGNTGFVVINILLVLLWITISRYLQREHGRWTRNAANPVPRPSGA